MLKPEKVEFDKYGQWLHPTLAAEEKEDVPISEYESAQGMEFKFIVLDDDLWEKWGNGQPVDLSKWNPDPPEGEGWFPICFTENEDCAFAGFARPAGGKGLADYEPGSVPDEDTREAYFRQMQAAEASHTPEDELTRLRELEAAAKDVYVNRHLIFSDTAAIFFFPKILSLGKFFPLRAWLEYKARVRDLKPVQNPVENPQVTKE